jgi:hypothetical protein
MLFDFLLIIVLDSYNSGIEIMEIIAVDFVKGHAILFL